MKRPIRYGIQIAGAIGCLLLFGWFCLIGYVILNKASLLEKLRSGLQDRLGGQVHIDRWDISFWRHFPNVTARLSDVSIRDSAWAQHHHDLLRAADVYVSCNLFRSLFSRRILIGELDIEHGQVYLFTDSTGYSNSSPLGKLKPDRPEKAAAPPPDIGLVDVRWVIERQDKHKLFDLDLRRVYCAIAAKDRILRLHISSRIQVNSLSFNTEKGSFIRNRRLSGNFLVEYNTASKIVQFRQAKLAIDDEPFLFSGRFFPTVVPDPFFLTIEADGVRFRQVSALLTPGLQQKLDAYDIDQPISVHAQLDAGSADDPTPQIQVRLDLGHGNVTTPAGRFTETAFSGTFTNEWQRGRTRGDENSMLRFTKFSGRLANLPLHSDTITINNLRYPRMACDLHSLFRLDELNELTGSQTLQFTGGTGTMDLHYKGPLSENDTAGTVVNGRIDLDSAVLVYLPYAFQLTGGKGRLLFHDQDLVIEQLNIRAGNSSIQVKGQAKNLIALLDRNAENVGVDLNLSTPHLDLEDLVVLAGKASAAHGGRTSHPMMGASFARIDRLLKEGAIHVGIEAGDLRFRKFTGARARADLVFDDHRIQLNKLSIAQGGGHIELKARLDRKTPDADIPLALEAHLSNVDLPDLFASFNNFGQDALTTKNLQGRLSADIRAGGAMTGRAKMVPNSLRASVDFTISGGELLDFAPIEKVRSTVLKNKDLSTIRFAELRNHLDLDSTTLAFQRMEIRSSAFTLFAEGTYDLKRGPDMSLQVPLSNITKNQNQDIPPESKGNDSRAGVSVRLRARRGDDGKLKISWDPFRKALKKPKQRVRRGAR